MSDAWTSLQAPGVAATEEAPPGTSIAYMDTGAFGRNVVAYQLGFELPDLCFKCGTAANHHRYRFRCIAREGLAHRLEALEEGRNPWYRQVDRKIEIDVPLCAKCCARRKQLEGARLVAGLSPVWVIGGAIVLHVITGHGGLALLVLLVAAIASVVRLARLKQRTHLWIERVDEDGLVRVSGVDYETAQLIVQQATRSA